MEITTQFVEGDVAATRRRSAQLATSVVSRKRFADLPTLWDENPARDKQWALPNAGQAGGYRIPDRNEALAWAAEATVDPRLVAGGHKRLDRSKGIPALRSARCCGHDVRARRRGRLLPQRRTVERPVLANRIAGQPSGSRVAQSSGGAPPGTLPRAEGLASTIIPWARPASFPTTWALRGSPRRPVFI